MNKQKDYTMHHIQEEQMKDRHLQGLLALQALPTDAEVGATEYARFMALIRWHRRRRVVVRFLGYVAAVVVLVIGTWMVSTQSLETAKTCYNVVTVPAGHRANIKLSDGTEVWLNANSTLRYPTAFNGETRQLELNGEAYFKVAHDEQHPLIVLTPKVWVKATGTTFNICCNDKQTDISLIEGEVAVGKAKSEKSVLLNPMQALSYRYEDGSASLSTISNEDNFSWIEGVLTLNAVPLSLIVEKIACYYKTQIVIRNAAVGRASYSGKFRLQDGPYEILRILQKGGHFQLYKDDVKNIIEIR